MRLLLDTHIALWAIVDDQRLSARARELLEDLDNQAFVSAASIWEISIKHVRRTSAMPISGAEALLRFRQAGYELLEISPQHAAAVGGLPPLHGDPFDRMLVAQALFEPMRLLTADVQLAAYDPSIIKV